MPRITQTSSGFTEAAVDIEWDISSESYIECYNVSVMGQNPVCVTTNKFSTSVSYSYLETSQMDVSLCVIDVCGNVSRAETASGTLTPHAGD